MLPLALYQLAFRLHPRLVPGAVLHRRALDVSLSGSPDQAERWFEAAAVCYREELAVEALARLRVHQLMTRVRARPRSEAAASEMLEIVRRLNRLDHLERLEPPFELCDARRVLAEWIERAETPSGALTHRGVPTPQAA